MQPIKKPATRINLAFFTLLLIGSFVIFSSVEAQTKEQFCQKGFIGYNYRPSMEKRCRTLWDTWTQQIINHK